MRETHPNKWPHSAQYGCLFFTRQLQSHEFRPDLFFVHWFGEGLEAPVLNEAVGDASQEEAELSEHVLLLLLQTLALLLRQLAWGRRRRYGQHLDRLQDCNKGVGGRRRGGGGGGESHRDMPHKDKGPQCPTLLERNHSFTVPHAKSHTRTYTHISISDTV